MSSPVPAITSCDTQHTQHISSAQMYTSVHTHMDWMHQHAHTTHTICYHRSDCIYLCTRTWIRNIIMHTQHTQSVCTQSVYTNHTQMDEIHHHPHTLHTSVHTPHIFRTCTTYTSSHTYHIHLYTHYTHSVHAPHTPAPTCTKYTNA